MSKYGTSGMLKKSKKFDIEGSNIENLGSKAEKDCKKAAAGQESAWIGVGQKPELRIWRIENFNVVVWPKNKYGQFFDGDSYIVMNTYKAEDTDKLYHDLHFWLGAETSQDEAGTAAYKTVELDTYLDDVPVQHREVMDRESQLFLTYFAKQGGIRILTGGVESGFNHVEPEKYEPKLLHLKGRKNIRVREVECSSTSLTEGDVYVLDAGLTLYQWRGKGCSLMEKNRACALTEEIESARGGKTETIILEQGAKDIPDEFWDLLGGETKPKPTQGCDEKWEAGCEKGLYQLTDAGGKLEFNQIARGKDCRIDLLDTNDVFIYDIGNEVYIWIGKGASKKEKASAFGTVQHFLKEHKRKAWTPISRIVEGKENPAFKQHFHHKKKGKKAQIKSWQSPQPVKGVESKGQSAMGCYLTYSSSSNGTLHLNWSMRKVDDALCYMKPTKSVPKFKFKKAGGREELTRGVDNTPKNKFQAWCNFVKMGKEFKGGVELYTDEIEIIFYQKGKLKAMPHNKYVALDKVEIVGVIPGKSKIFDGINKIDKSAFINKSQKAGGALVMPK